MTARAISSSDGVPHLISSNGTVDFGVSQYYVHIISMSHLCRKVTV